MPYYENQNKRHIGYYYKRKVKSILLLHGPSMYAYTWVETAMPKTSYTIRMYACTVKCSCILYYAVELNID